MKEEIWKPVEGFESKYAVSNLGQVKSLARTRKCRTKDGIITMSVPERILKQWKRSSYNLVDFWIDGKRFVKSVHVLVYQAFIGEIKKGNFIHHKDGNKFNNTPENLEEMTVLEHNRKHHIGRKAWNKGKTMPKESYAKMWKTRFEKYGKSGRKSVK